MKADGFKNPVIAFQGVAVGPTPLQNKMEIQGAVLAVEGQHPTEIQRAALAAKASTPGGGGGGGGGMELHWLSKANTLGVGGGCIGCQGPTQGRGGLHWL